MGVDVNNFVLSAFIKLTINHAVLSQSRSKKEKNHRFFNDDCALPKNLLSYNEPNFSSEHRSETKRF